MTSPSASSAATPTLAALSSALVEAHRSGGGRSLSDLPEPADRAEAMAVQAAVAGALGAEVGGWKVTVRPDGVAVGAPLYRDRLLASGGSYRMPASGIARLELEIGVRLSADLPPRPDRPYSREEVLRAVGTVLVGLELIEHRLVTNGPPPFPALLADNLGNGAYVVGSGRPPAADEDLSRLRATLVADGEILHDAVGGHAFGDPLLPLVAYANDPSDLLGGLKAGQVVTTGTLCGVVEIRNPAKIKATIQGIGDLTLDIVAR